MRSCGFMVIGALATPVLLLTVPAPAAPRSAPPVLAGAAVVDITPKEEPVYLAGFGPNRTATGVHDTLHARALVLRRGETTVGLLVFDLIGLGYHHVQQIRQAVRAIPADHVIIACTHVHSGPDTIGLWGPSPGTSGVSDAYMQRLATQGAAAIARAAKEARPARFRFGTATVPDGYTHNARERPIQDRELSILQAIDTSGQTIATLVNYASHPEVLMSENRMVTADFCGYTLRKVESKLGGVGLYFNGALGGMVTPEVSVRTFAEAERVGDGVATAALRALVGQPARELDRLQLRRRQLEIPLENLTFQMMLAAGILKGSLKDGALTTEVCRLDLGEARLVTVPGELLPKPGLELKQRMGGRPRFLIGLGNDELGYILDPADYDLPLYRYEKSMSVGRQAWPRIRDALDALLKEP
jgi:hypothetical protein